MTGPLTPRAARKVAPFRPDDFSGDAIARSLLIEERQHTRAARRMIVLCIVALAAFVGWATITPVHEAVTGSGKLLPEDRLRRVQHLEGGIVETVLATPGQVVERGDVLVRLDGTQVRAELEKAEARLAALGLSLERLHSLADSGRAVRFADGSDSLLLSQSEALAGAQRHLETQMQLIESERAALQAQLPLVERRREAIERELDFVRRILAEQQRSLDKGFSTRDRRDVATRDALELERLLAEIEGAKAATEADLAGLAAREAELLSGWRREALEKAAELEVEREETVAHVAQLRDRLARLEIVAPIGGRVNVLGVEGPREVIAPGQTVAEIVPEGGEVFARIEVPASRIGGVAPGMEAKVRVLTYDYTRFGSIDATVDGISPSSIVKDDGEQVFEVRLKLAASHVGTEGAGLDARSGMTVSADIVTGRKPLIAYLLKPVRVLSDRAFRET